MLPADGVKAFGLTTDVWLSLTIGRFRLCICREWPWLLWWFHKRADPWRFRLFIFCRVPWVVYEVVKVRWKGGETTATGVLICVEPGTPAP